MNREQRRAALRQAGKVKGFDITRGTLEVSIANSDEKLTVDVMDFEVTESIYNLVRNFSRLEETYKEDYDKAFNSGAEDIDSKFQLMKKVITDFSSAIEKIFGEDSCVKLFGHKYPMLVQINEFIEDFAPVATTILANAGFDELAQQGDNVVTIQTPKTTVGNVEG